MKKLDDFIQDNEVDEILYFSNHETAWRNACMLAGIDPDELANKQFLKEKRRK